MAILWCGGEDLDFADFTGCSMSTTLGFRSSYARAGITLGDAAAAVSNQFSGGAVTSCWVRFYQLGNGFATNKFVGLGAFGTPYKGLWVGTGTSDSKVAIWKYVTSWTKLAEESGNHYVNTGLLIDVQLISYGATGTINVYANGVLAVTYTGDLSVSGVSGFDCVMLGAVSTNSNPIVSEIIVSDTDTRNFPGLKTLAPTSDGTTTDWTGAYTEVDEATISDADVNYTDTADKDQAFNVSNMPTGSFVIGAVKIACRATKSEDASIGKIALGYYSGSTAVGDDQSLTTAWATYESLDLTNPVTGAAFQQSEMNDLQINVRSRA